MTSEELTQKLNGLKAQVQKAQTDKAKAEATIENLSKQRETVVGELSQLGVTPENLDPEIARLEEEIAANLARAEELLPH